MEEFRSVFGKKKQKKYNEIGKEESDLYNSVREERAQRRKSGGFKRFLMYSALICAVGYGTLKTGLLTTEDIKGAYQSVKSFVTGEETPSPKKAIVVDYKTIDHKIDGGN